MRYTSIVNHTRVTLKFEMGGKSFVLGSKGAFNLNHAYDFEKQGDVIRVVEDQFICDIAKKLGHHNFIPLSALVNYNEAGYKLFTDLDDPALHIYTMSGLGTTKLTMYNYNVGAVIANKAHMYIFTTNNDFDCNFAVLPFETLLKNSIGDDDED